VDKITHGGVFGCPSNSVGMGSGEPL